MYNNFLRTKPGFGGKITVKFKILPDGNVETGEIVGTTMNFPEFEKAVLDDILQWKFDAGDYSNCTVTIPFTFSE
jgi:protein TonB